MSMSALAWAYEQVGLKPGVKTVLVCLAWHADKTTGTAHPGIDLISRETGLEERAVRRNLDALEKRGFFVRQRRHFSDGRRKGMRLPDGFKLSVGSKRQPDKSHNGQPDISNNCGNGQPDISAETTGQSGRPNRTFQQGQPDISSIAYKDEPRLEPRSEPNQGTKTLDNSPHSSVSGKAKKSQKAIQISDSCEATKQSPLPVDWPDDLLRSEAIEFWRGADRPDLIADIDRHASQARNHHEARGSRFASWPAVWRNWFQNTVKFERAPSAAPKHGTSIFAIAGQLIEEARNES